MAKFCKNCGKQLNEKQTNFCSYECNNAWKKRGIPTPEELKELLEKYKNFSAILSISFFKKSSIVVI